MSAFVVSNRTVNQVVTHLENNRDSSWVQDQLEKAGLPTGGEELGAAMMALNVDAVNQRYTDSDTLPGSTRDYEHRHEPVNRHQALMSLHCWNYQCSEGDVPQHPLYKIMDDYANSLAYAIVSDMPEYEAAVWDPPESTEPPLIKLTDLVK